MKTLILLGIVILVLVSANELGYGVVAFPILVPVASWLMHRFVGGK